MGEFRSAVGKLIVSCFPTWDAHHLAIEHRPEHTDESWAKVIADPDWTEHSREELRAARVCDGCLTVVARGNGTGGARAQAQVQAELDRRAAALAH